MKVREALAALKEGYTLRLVNEGKESLLTWDEDNVVLQDDNMKIHLSVVDFLDLYQGMDFYPTLEEEETVDMKKDEEYYSWGKKM